MITLSEHSSLFSFFTSSIYLFIFWLCCCILSTTTTFCNHYTGKYIHYNYIYRYQPEVSIKTRISSFYNFLRLSHEKKLQVTGGINSSPNINRNIISKHKLQPVIRTQNFTHSNISTLKIDLIDQWRKSLSLQLQNRRGALQYIKIPVGITSRKKDNSNPLITCHVYLLGTAHISRKSCVDSRQLLEYVKPDCLFVELCHQRLDLIEEKLEDFERNYSQSKTKMDDHLSNTGITRTAAFGSMLLSKIQNDYANKLNVSIGGEFKEAFRIALDQQTNFVSYLYGLQSQHCSPNALKEDNKVKNGCSVILGDRPVLLTLTRAWESLNTFGKVKLILGLLWSLIRQPDKEELNSWIDSILNDPSNDILSESIRELSYHFPTIHTTIICERDKYMASKLLQTIRMLGDSSINDNRERKIVAVVGAGHILGIMNELHKYCHQWYDGKTSNEEQHIMLENIIGSLIETEKLKSNNNECIQSLKSELVAIDMNSLSEKLSIRNSKMSR